MPAPKGLFPPPPPLGTRMAGLVVSQERIFADNGFLGILHGPIIYFSWYLLESNIGIPQ